MPANTIAASAEEIITALADLENALTASRRQRLRASDVWDGLLRVHIMNEGLTTPGTTRPGTATGPHELDAADTSNTSAATHVKAASNILAVSSAIIAKLAGVVPPVAAASAALLT